MTLPARLTPLQVYRPLSGKSALKSTRMLQRASLWSGMMCVLMEFSLLMTRESLWYHSIEGRGKPLMQHVKLKRSALSGFLCTGVSSIFGETEIKTFMTLYVVNGGTPTVNCKICLFRTS